MWRPLHLSPSATRVLGWCVVTWLFLDVITISDASTKRHSKRQSRLLADEQRLVRKLMDDYEPSVRPVLNATSTIGVRFGITYVQLLDMDEVNQVLTSNVWLEQASNPTLTKEWDDERLTWNPRDYNGLAVLRMPCERIWLPDVVLYNSADDFTDGYMQSRAMVRHTGNVFWAPPAKLRSSCKIDITFFPFDDQICTLKFGSWTYDGFQVDLTNRSSSVDLSNYVFSGEWELLGISIVRNEVYYLCCDEPFPDVTFKVLMRRRTLYYLINIIFPCLWLTVLSLLCFWLPPDSGEKITLGITVLLAYTVFMLVVAESMPATSEFVPIIGIFLMITMSMTSISIVLTVFILQLHHAGPNQTPVPRWLRLIVINGIGRILCVRTSTRYHGYTRTELDSIADDTHRESLESPGDVEHKVCSGRLLGEVDESSLVNRDVTEESILEQIEAWLLRQDKEDGFTDVVNEWRLVAHVMDKLLFWLYLIGAVASSLAILVLKPMSKPHLE